MSRRKKNADVKKIISMEMPPWLPGELVSLDFLGTRKTGYVISLHKNPQHIERWIYRIKDSIDGTIYPWVGVGDSEKFSNINIESTDLLTKY